eukprot:878597-Rhodomonas_salina.2
MMTRMLPLSWAESGFLRLRLAVQVSQGSLFTFRVKACTLLFLPRWQSWSRSVSRTQAHLLGAAAPESSSQAFNVTVSGSSLSAAAPPHWQSAA